MARKQAGGAEKQRKKKEIAAASGKMGKDTGRWAVAFRRAGKPDLDNPDTDLDYTRRLQLIVLQQMATTPFPTLAQMETWRRIREMSATVGMTSNRAALESKVKRLEKQLAERERKGAVQFRKTVAKPSTARGERPPGPRPVAPEMPDDAPVEPESDKPNP